MKRYGLRPTPILEEEKTALLGDFPLPFPSPFPFSRGSVEDIDLLLFSFLFFLPSLFTGKQGPPSPSCACMDFLSVFLSQRSKWRICRLAALSEEWSALKANDRPHPPSFSLLSCKIRRSPYFSPWSLPDRQTCTVPGLLFSPSSSRKKRGGGLRWCAFWNLKEER